MKVHMNDWASELWIRGVITQWVISTSMTEHAESQHNPLWHDGTCPDDDNRRFARKRAKSDRADAHSVAVFSDISSFNNRLFGNISIKQQKFEKFQIIYKKTHYKKHINITLYLDFSFFHTMIVNGVQCFFFFFVSWHFQKHLKHISKYKVIQAWNNMRVSKWWQNCLLWVNKQFNDLGFAKKNMRDREFKVCLLSMTL